MDDSLLVPADFQPALPHDRLILEGELDAERIDVDVLFVGGGPAGLAGAIELARLVKQGNEGGDGPGEVTIGVLEKAGALGEHSLSGAVVNPRPFRYLFPELPDSELPFRRPVQAESMYLLSRNGARRLPMPRPMHNRGNFIASICEIVRWLGERAEELGVDLFAGFPAGALRVEGDAVVGVRTVASGLDRDGNPGSNYLPATDIAARVTALAEGSRGMLTQSYLEWQGISSVNPPIYALGVKELWETKQTLDKVVHTMGWPVPRDAFGGSFMYPLEPNLVAVGLVVGMDYRERDLDVHELLQLLKSHSLFRPYFADGELIEWGAKTIPEGGYHALPERRHGDGVVILGDAAGFVDVPSLKGIHYAMQSGIFGARAIYRALQKGDTTAATLVEYDKLIADSYVTHDLYRSRNMRAAFKSGFYSGALKAALMSLTSGRFPGSTIHLEQDARAPRRVAAAGRPEPDRQVACSKVDAVFKSGNVTRDDIPSHLIVGETVPAELATFYSHMCPAGVYEQVDGELRVNAPNCVDCKATDVLGPRWTPREGGSGPAYKRM